MLQGFEEAFTDAQASIVSLALELLENGEKEADMVYIYIYQNDSMNFVNAFFAKDKKIVLLNHWFEDEQILEFFGCMRKDMKHITEVCNKYDGKRPIEFRLSYNVNTKAFDAKYNYDDFAGDGDVDLVDVFEDWQKECEAELNS
jgi:hypothetical protein